MEEDWNTTQIYFEQNHTIKKCKPEDFGPDKASQDYWHTWITEKYAFDIFCPDFNQNDLNMYNQKGAMNSKSIIF